MEIATRVPDLPEAATRDAVSEMDRTKGPSVLRVQRKTFVSAAIAWSSGV